MKRIAFPLFAALALFACNNDAKKESNAETTVNNSDTSMTNNEAWVPVDSAKAMKDWMDFATPGKVHEMMASWNGSWTGQVTSWMAEGAPPSTGTTSTVNSMILDGRYQTSKHSGSFSGMPFEGIGTMGYDNGKKMFVSSWVDNMGTGIMFMSGSWDEASKTMTLNGKQTDPSRPGKDCNVREVYKIVDDNNHVMEMYGPDPMTGKEFKMMEIKMTRKGK